MSIRFVIGKLLLKLPLIRYKQFVYSLLGVKCAQKGCKYFIAILVLLVITAISVCMRIRR